MHQTKPPPGAHVQCLWVKWSWQWWISQMTHKSLDGHSAHLLIYWIVQVLPHHCWFCIPVASHSHFLLRGMAQRQISRRATVALTSPARSDGPERRGLSMGQWGKYILCMCIYIYNSRSIHNIHISQETTYIYIYTLTRAADLSTMNIYERWHMLNWVVHYRLWRFPELTKRTCQNK